MLPPFAALQEPKPPIVRKIEAREGASYRAVVDAVGENSAHFEYRIRLVPLAVRAGKLKKHSKLESNGDRRVQFLLTDLVAQYGDKKVQQGDFGVVPLFLGESGMPGGLTFKGQATPFVLPLMSWFLPPAGSVAEKSFDLEPGVIDDNIDVTGYGRFGKPENGKQDITLDADFKIEKVDIVRKRKLVLAILIDPADGEVISASGKYTAPDGTVQFRIRRE